MTDQDDPFADLEDTVSGDSNDTEEQEQSAPESSAAGDTDPSATSTVDAESDTDPIETRAFEFDETRQSAFYVREATWDEFDTLMTEIELAAKKRGAKNVTKSEIHDAILRNIDAEEIAEAVVDERQR